VFLYSQEHIREIFYRLPLHFPKARTLIVTDINLENSSTSFRIGLETPVLLCSQQPTVSTMSPLNPARNLTSSFRCSVWAKEFTRICVPLLIMLAFSFQCTSRRATLYQTSPTACTHHTRNDTQRPREVRPTVRSLIPQSCGDMRRSAVSGTGLTAWLG
jgi:hypothetical protein